MQAVGVAGRLTTGAALHDGRRGVHAADRLDGELELSSSALPQAYTIVWTPSARSRSAGPIATLSVPASTTSAETAPGGCRHCPHPVHQVGQHRVATSPHVDGGSGRVVADGEPGLSGRDLGGVVDVRREPRLAALVQVIDDGDVGTDRHAHPARVHDRLPVGTVSGGDDIEVVSARRAVGSVSVPGLKSENSASPPA